MAVFDSRSFDSGTFDSALTYGGTFAAFSVVLRTMPVAGASFTADAVIAPYARLYQLPVEAVILPTDQQARVYQLPVEVVVLPDDQQARLYQLPVEAVVLPTDQQAHLYQLPVEVVRQSYVRRSGSFSAEFELLIGHRIFASFTADAIIKREFEQTFSAKAEAEIVGRMHGNFLPQAIVLRPDNNGSFAAGAVIKKAMPGGLTADAIRKKTQTSTVTQFPAIDTEATVSPWVAGPIYAYYNSAALSISTGSAPVGYGSNSLRITTTALSSDQMAYVPITGTFLAGVQYKLTFWIKKVSGTFTYVRVIFGSQNTNDRTASRAGSGTGPAPSVSWSLQTIYWTPATSRTDAVLALCSYGTAAIGIDVDGVVVTATIPFAFTLNAVRIKTQIKPGFTADAWLKPMFFLADAALLWTANWSFTASAIIQSATPPVVIPPAGKPYVEIWVNGIEYTKHVIWSTVSFTAKVNGAVGEGFLQILDRDHVFDFTFGQEVYLNIDGVIRWGGWILRPQRTYVMPVITNVMLEPRTWVLECIDFNAIFDKRVIYDIARPGKVWEYLPGTYDDTIINDVWNYLDMEGFTKDINRVAPAILDITGFTAKSIVASGGFTFREIMTAITRTTAAIFYCTPEKVITYVDSDKINSIYTLTDTPYVVSGGGSTLIFSDNFNRYASPGLGGDWSASSDEGGYDYAIADGSAAVMADPIRGYSSYRNPGFVKPEAGIVQFDFWVPPLSQQDNVFPTTGIALDDANSPVWTYVHPTGTIGTWTLGPQYYNTDRNITPVNFYPDESTWYTVETSWDPARNCEWRLWKQGGQRPAVPILAGRFTESYAMNDGVPFIDFYYKTGPGRTGSAKMDNLKVYSVQGTWSEELVFSDTFTRTVTSGLGSDYTHYAGSTGYSSVNGSYAMVSGANTYEYFTVTPVVGLDGPITVQFDFWVQSVASHQSSSYDMYYWVEIGNVYFDVWVSTHVQSPMPSYFDIGGANHLIDLDESSWYTAKVSSVAAGEDVAVRAKVWKRGTTEPDWMATDGYANLGDGIIELDSLLAEKAAIDNLQVWSNTWSAGGTDIGDEGDLIENAVAYREIRIREDATSMVNDALVWGAGYGNKNLVFSRTQSSPSQTVHGLWQAGEFKNGVYKQATVNAISASWVEGSPSAHRGAKNPKRSVELVTQSTVFSAGDVVVVQNSSFEYTDTLPIRSVITTFPTPFDPRFALTMSWEIDAVWSMYDPWVPYSPKMISPVVVPPEKVTPPKSKPHEAWFVTSGQAGVPFLNATDYFENDFLDFIYYVPNEYGTASNFELFSRTVSSGWGTSTDSHTWTSVYSGNWSTTGIVNGTMSVDGSDGIHRVKPTGTRSVREILSQTNPGGPWTGAHWFRRDRWVPTWNEASLDPRYYSLVVGFVDSRDNRWIWWISINWSNSGAGSFKICERGFGCSDSASVVINQGSTNTITHQHDEEIEGTTDTVCVNGVCITVFRGNPDCNLSTYVVDGFTRANRTGLGPTEDGTLTWTADATSWIESYKAHVHKSTNGTMLPLGLDIAPPIRGTITRPSPPPSSPSSGSVSFIQQPLDFDITVSWTEEWFVTPEMGYWMVTDWSLKVPRGVNETGPYTGPASITTTTCAPNGPMLTNDLYVGGTAIMDPIMNASYNLVTHDVTGLYYNQGVDIYFHNTGYGYNTIYHSDNVHFLFVYDPDTKLWRMAFEDLGGGAGPTPPSGVTPDGFADVYATIDFGDYDVTGIYPIGWGLGYQTIDGEDFEVNYPFEVILDVQPEKITATIDGHSIEATENIGILNPVSDYSLMRNGTELTFDYLFIETCINTAPTDAIGQRACDVLEPQHGLEGDFWPNPMEWKTVTATYIPGSTKLAINGVYQFGYSETDPENGIVTTSTVIGRDDVVTLCYLTNGRLPYVPIVPEGAR